MEDDQGLLKALKQAQENFSNIKGRLRDIEHKYEDIILKIDSSTLDVRLSVYTCYNCPDRHTCKEAWDHYNVCGDCLGCK